jgi:alpha-glucosidase (family GH31 glycosyl hydrolase)
MLGRQILVAPVMEKTDKWNVYLPKGKWVHYWTGKEYEGGQTITVDAPLYGKDGLPMFVKAGAIIPMMPEMSYIYEKTPEPITLDVYLPPTHPSTHVMYDCDTPRSTIEQTVFKCSQDKTKIDVSISPSNVPYELCVHYDKQPASVTADSKELSRLEDKSAYDAAAEGWYFGPGCFYSNDKLNTVNIKIPRSPKPLLIRITK